MTSSDAAPEQPSVSARVLARLLGIIKGANTVRGTFDLPYSDIPGFDLHFVIGGKGKPLRLYKMRDCCRSTIDNCDHIAEVPVGPAADQGEITRHLMRP
jgi:hypothetical protein